MIKRELTVDEIEVWTTDIKEDQLYVPKQGNRNVYRYVLEVDNKRVKTEKFEVSNGNRITSYKSDDWMTKEYFQNNYTKLPKGFKLNFSVTLEGE